MKPSTRKRQGAPLPLHNGDHMKQPEFHRRYETYPEDVKFELIGGVVYMGSRVGHLHGTSHAELGAVLGLYKSRTPGVEAGDNMTAILGEESEPQPDLMLRILTESGGQSHYNEENYLVGAPEQVCEVAHSTRSIDMNRKRRDYLAAGVQEYLVYCIEEEQIHWFHFPSRRKLKADRAGIWKSRVFPGLWIDEAALVARDTNRLLAVVQQGLATPEHEAFVRQLEARRGR